MPSGLAALVLAGLNYIYRAAVYSQAEVKVTVVELEGLHIRAASTIVLQRAKLPLTVWGRYFVKLIMFYITVYNLRTQNVLCPLKNNNCNCSLIPQRLLSKSLL